MTKKNQTNLLSMILLNNIVSLVKNIKNTFFLNRNLMVCYLMNGKKE